MKNNSKPKLPIQVIFAIMLVMAAFCTAIIVVVPAVFPTILKPTATSTQAPTSTLPILSKQSLAETSVISTDTPILAVTSTIMPTDRPTITFTPTYTANQLPDLVVGGISNPTCARDHLLRTTRVYIKFSVIVRNVGHVSTRSFGKFSVLVNLIIGQHRYSLDDWASSFDGVVDRSDMDFPNLNPNNDVKLNAAIYLKGNRKFGVEAIANSGSSPIPESNTTNNTLIKSFSIICF